MHGGSDRGREDDVKIPKGAPIKPINGTDVVVSEHLPIHPDHREDARRTVRHGLRRWVEYIGEKVGPAPGEPMHAFMGSDGSRNGPMMLFVSREMWVELRGEETP